MNEEEIKKMVSEPRKRNIAFKFEISSLNNSNITIDDDSIFNFVEINNKQINRVNIIATCIDKFVSESEKKFATLTIDDGSGQVRIKSFGEDIEKIKKIEIGDSILVIGNLRYFSNELYILPEILRILDAKWLLARKLELTQESNKEIVENKIITQEKEIPKEIEKNTDEMILEILKENKEGINVDEIIMHIKKPVEEINNSISELLDNAEIYEPRPGRIRLL